MGTARLVGSVALLLALVGGGIALGAWQRGDGGADGAFPVQVLGPDGALFDGEVRLANATALSALEAAAREAGLEVRVQRYPGMGSYVRAVGPYKAEGAAGWVYEVREGETWRGGDRSAEFYPLPAGAAVRWRWVDGE